MVSEFILKKKRNWILMVLALLLVSFAGLCIYATKSRNYPYHVASMWQCKEPSFSLIYGRDESDMLTSYEELKWDNETFQVELCFLMREYVVFPAGSSAYEDRLFGGTWKYCKGNLILTVKEDYLFDDKYSELVFSPIS